MEMTLRWYGSKFDTVTLEQIRQIPGVTGVITTLYDTAPGEVWSRERIAALKAEVAAAGLHISGIESVNVHDAIKTGAPDRDLYIDHYIETLENLGKEDIHLVCYNFMPVFDWTRTELARKRPDGSTAVSYTHLDVYKRQLRAHCDNRNHLRILVRHPSDLPCRLKTVHLRHHNIHQDRIEIMLFPLHKKLQRLPSIFRTDDFHAPALQKLPRNLNIERMILREKHPLPPERGKRLSGTCLLYTSRCV